MIESRNSLILSRIEANALNNDTYSLVAKVVRVSVALLVSILGDRFARAADVQTSWTGCGPAYLGDIDKGAVDVRFRLTGEKLPIGLSVPLMAYQHNPPQRIADYDYIVGSFGFPPFPT